MDREAGLGAREWGLGGCDLGLGVRAEGLSDKNPATSAGSYEIQVPSAKRRFVRIPSPKPQAPSPDSSSAFLTQWRPDNV